MILHYIKKSVYYLIRHKRYPRYGCTYLNSYYLSLLNHQTNTIALKFQQEQKMVELHTSLHTDKQLHLGHDSNVQRRHRRNAVGRRHFDN